VRFALPVGEEQNYLELPPGSSEFFNFFDFPCKKVVFPLVRRTDPGAYHKKNRPGSGTAFLTKPRQGLG
jgi:hypothetical protein